MIAGCDNSGQAKAERELLERSLLFNDESEALFIKKDGVLVPIGGSAKQNRLIAGDNIEITPEEGVTDYPRDIIRLVDDPIVRTLTIRPDEEVPDWKGTYKVGELHNGNTVWMISKGTQIADTEQGIFGGTLLVKMVTAEDKEIFAEYAITITSTGSWSLEGGTNFGPNVRVCRARPIGTQDWYYGLKVPEGRFKNRRTVDNPTIEEVDLSYNVNLRLGEDADTISLYGNDVEHPLTKETHIRNYGFASGDGYSRDLWTMPIEDYAEIANWNGRNPATVMDEEDVLEYTWKDWLDKGYKLGLTLDTKPAEKTDWIVHAITREVYLYKNNSGNESATYRLGSNGHDYTMTDHGRSSGILHDGTSNYNHIYSITMPQFFDACGITPQGEWAKWNNNNYRFRMRIYTDGRTLNGVKQHKTRITVVQVVDSNGNAVRDITVDDPDIEFNWDNPIMNYTASEYPDIMDDTWTDILKFIDRSPNPETDVEKLAINAVNVQVLDEDNNPVTNDVNFTKFNAAYANTYFTQVSNFTNNRAPIFSTNANRVATLSFAGQEGVDDDKSTSLLGVQNSHYRYITQHNYTIEEFWDTLRVEDTEFWFNGWNDIPESLQPTQMDTDQLEYQILAKESQDEDSFSEIFVWDTDKTIPQMVSKIENLQKLGEDAPPYKFIVAGRSLTINDLRTIGNSLKIPDRQVWLDLSECWMANNNQNLNVPVFEGCSSLRGITMPQRITRISTGIFIWCTYLRFMDLSPSFNTLARIGNSGSGNTGTDWNQNIGTFTSTRIKTLILPKAIRYLDAYIVYSSNIQNLIWYGEGQNDWPRTQETIAQRTFGGIPLGSSSDVYSGVLPKGFHCFLEQTFYNNHPTDWLWNNDSGWYTKDFVNSIVTYNRNWTQEQWQNFNDTYNWGEELINQVRQHWGKTDYIEIAENY